MQEVEEDDNILPIDPTKFSEVEKRSFLEVVTRDEGFYQAEQSRIHRLVNEWRGVLARGIADEDEAHFTHHCKRCCAPFGWFVNTGALCALCRKKVCKKCRVVPPKMSRRTLNNGSPKWLCVVCSNSRELFMSSGAWFYTRGRRGSSKSKKGLAYGSVLLKMVFSIATQKDSDVFKDPVWGELFEEIEHPSNTNPSDLNNGEGDLTMQEIEDSGISGNSGHGETRRFQLLNEVIGGSQTRLSDIESEDELVATAESEVYAEPEVFKNNRRKSQITFEGDDAVTNNTLTHFGSRGKVQISFLYKEEESIFEIHIFKAINLLTADSTQLTVHPYAKTYLSSARHSLGKKKTKVVKSTLNPEFDEIISYHINYEELITSTCSVGIWHQEFAGKNVLLGEVDIDVGDLEMSGEGSLELPVKRWYTIYRSLKVRTSSVLSIPSLYSRASSGSVLSLYSSAGGRTNNTQITGEILLALKHTGEELVVYVEKAKDLKSVDVRSGVSNPYCKVYLYPDETRTTKKKTTHRKRTVNPLWNEAIRYTIPVTELLQKILQVSVWNHDRFGRNDFLGEVQINVSDYCATNNLEHNIPMWYTLQVRIIFLLLYNASNDVHLHPRGVSRMLTIAH